MDPIDLFQRAIDQTGRIVSAVRADQLGDSTPCGDWDVRALLNHTIGVVEMFNGSAQGKPFDPSLFERDNVGTDPGTSYANNAGPLKQTVSAAGVLDNNWTMPFGEVPGPVGCSFATMELTAHGWDVAKATGQQFEFDADVTEAAMATAQMAAPQIRGRGVFDDEAPCPHGATPTDQFAAFLGRTF